MLKYLRFPFDDDAVGVAVNITGGLLAGRRAVIDSLPDDPQSWSLLVELDRAGAKVWIDAAHLEERENAEIYSDRPEIMRALASFAEVELRRARKGGEHILAQTRRGAVALRYDRQTRIYTLTTQDGGSWTTSGKAAAVKGIVLNLFDTQEEPEEAGAGEGRKAA